MLSERETALCNAVLALSGTDARAPTGDMASTRAPAVGLPSKFPGCLAAHKKNYQDQEKNLH